MAIDVDTKDCTSLSDAELVELGDICTDGPARIDIGMLSKQREEWVLITQARSSEGVEGFSFCTLERIGGTPSVLIGLASVRRCPDAGAVLAGLMGHQLRRAVLAFPDEDVLVGTRFVDPAGFEAFTAFMELEDVVPRPGHKATGEERAWGRRLAKRFGVDSGYRDREFVAEGDGSPPCVLDYASTDPAAVDPEVRRFFEAVDVARGDCLVAFGWAMAEDLAALA
ncbi:MAG: hypothetical protein KY447_12835 [Actinobacteria bacterium]|nr:hypothetical protein [Actinomycetota bacterium]MBW3643788.1 hypothetical protein [Actinomycetota bacterium]